MARYQEGWGEKQGVPEMDIGHGPSYPGPGELSAKYRVYANKYLSDQKPQNPATPKSPKK